MKFPKMFKTSAALVLAFLAFALPARATTLLPINLAQLSKRAEFILYGTATDLRLVEENGKVVQYVTIAVTDWIKGQPTSDNTYIFSQATARDHGFGLNSELPAYKTGKTYLLFLPTTQDGPVAPVGGAQGVFAVTNGQIPDLPRRRPFLLKNMPQAATSPQAALIHKALDASASDTSLLTFKNAIIASFDLP